MRKKLKNDQRGFTLVELIVTILIMSIVMVAAAGFIITAINSYRVADIEVELQTEAQIAMNQFNDILIEAKQYDFTEDAGGGSRLMVVTPGDAENPGDTTYYFTVKNNELLFSKSLTETDPPLLARYCRSLEISPQKYPPAPGDENRLVTVTIEFEYAGRTYTTTSCISLRNQISSAAP
ncbi:MAG: type II secretion system GspH family protein [Lachnospiraceae bacterium]|nr:type II secretion system GspH family protein [Lachnospiraceae bacterium]